MTRKACQNIKPTVLIIWANEILPSPALICCFWFMLQISSVFFLSSFTCTPYASWFLWFTYACIKKTTQCDLNFTEKSPNQTVSRKKKQKQKDFMQRLSIFLMHPKNGIQPLVIYIQFTPLLTNSFVDMLSETTNTNNQPTNHIKKCPQRTSTILSTEFIGPTGFYFLVSVWRWRFGWFNRTLRME